ncbi:MAG: hypothetical protein RBT41_06920 [Clostridia bacterium]|jgi:peptidoglycan hydrolase CwlO-like protein|nr:hypothetical protein [Clostridia bacterium]
MNENQFGVLLEDVRDMVKGLAEGQKVMEERMDNMQKDISDIQQDVKHLDQKMLRFERKLDSVVTYTAQVAEKVTDHEIRITVLERR